MPTVCCLLVPVKEWSSLFLMETMVCHQMRRVSQNGMMVFIITSKRLAFRKYNLSDYLCPAIVPNTPGQQLELF